MADILEGLSANPPVVQEYESVPQQEEVSAYPSIEQFTTDPRFQKLNEFQKGARLAKYQTGLVKYLNETHGFSSQEEFDETISTIQERMRKHVPNPNNLSTALKSMFGFNPGVELVSEVAGAGATGRAVSKSQSIRADMRKIAQQEAMMSAGTDGDFAFQQAMSPRVLEKHVRETDQAFKEWESLRQGANLVIEQDEERGGRDFIGGGEFNLTTIGAAGNRLAADVAGGIASGVAGPAGTFSYFALTSAARSDKAQRELYPERTASERSLRAGITGIAVGALDKISFGYLTNTIRAKGVTEIVSKSMIGRVTAAGVAEASTEFLQTYAEAFGNNVEALDDFVTIMQDDDVAKEALLSAGIGGILGGGVRGGIETATVAFNKLAPEDFHKIVQTKAFTDKLKELEAKKEKLDKSSREMESIGGLHNEVIKSSARMVEDAEAVIRETGDKLKESSEFKGIPDYKKSAISESDILTRAEAIEQGESAKMSMRDIISEKIDTLFADKKILEDNDVNSPPELARYLITTGLYDNYIDSIKRMSKDISEDAATDIVDKAIIRQFKKGVAKGREVKAGIEGKGQYEGVPEFERELPPASEGFAFGEQHEADVAAGKSRYGEDDLVTGPEAKEQGGKVLPEPKDVKLQKKQESRQRIIRETVVANGGIRVDEDKGLDTKGFHKDVLEVDGKPSFSPRFKATGKKGLKLDEHIEILKETPGALVDENTSPEEVIAALAGNLKDIENTLEYEPTLDELKELQEKKRSDRFVSEYEQQLFERDILAPRKKNSFEKWKEAQALEERAKEEVVESVPSPPVTKPALPPIDFTEKGTRSDPMGIKFPELKPGNEQDIGGFEGSKVDRFVREWFTKERNVSPEVYKAGRKRQGEINGLVRRAKIIDRRLKKEIKKTLGGNPKPEQLVGLNDFLLGDRTAKDLIDTGAGPLVPILTEMRSNIDEMSKKLIEVGAIPESLEPQIKANLGTYLTRSYRLFLDDKWKGKVSDADMDAARGFFREQLLLQDEGDITSEAELSDRVEGMVREVLDAPDIEFFQKGKPGSKNIDVLKKRKDVPKELRALMGEVKDPRVNFMNSMIKMANLSANQEFLTKIKEIGLKEGWMSEKQTKKSFRQYSSEGSRTTDPLNGMYLDPKMADAMEDLYSPDTVQGWLKNAITVTGWAKAAKTILSPASQVRNFVANMLFMFAGGYANPKIWKNAAETTLSNLGLDAVSGKFNQEVFAEKLEYYTKLGLIGDSIGMGEIINILKDNDTAQESLQEFSDKLAIRGLKWGFDKAAQLYGAGDDFFKIVAFEGERERYVKAGVPKTDSEIAEIVTDTLPTYSKTGKAVDLVRKIPLIGTFPSFPAEIIRTTTNHWRLALSEIKSDNKNLKHIGFNRMLRLSSAMAVPAAVIGLGQAAIMATMDEEEKKEYEKFLKEKDKTNRLLPPWARYSNVLYLGPPKDGKVRYIDTGFSDPFVVFKKPFNALMDEDGGIKEAAWELASNFIGEDMVAQKLIDISRNKKKNSNSVVFEDTDLMSDKISKSWDHVWKSFEPGGATSMKRIYEGYTGAVNDSGRSRNLTDEIIAATSGTRFSEIDTKTTMHFKVSEYQKGIHSLKRSLNKDVFTSRTGQTQDELKESFERFKVGHREFFIQMTKDIEAARIMGVSDKDIKSSLKSSRISRSTISSLMSGAYRTPVPDSEFKKKMRELKK
jgi:hypothetical protein